MAHERYKSRSIAKDLWHEHIARKPETNFRFSDCPRYVTFTYPGMDPSYLAYETGNPMIARLVQLLDDIFEFSVSRMIYQNGRLSDFINSEKIYEGNLVFYASGEYIFSRAMYDPSIPKWPLDAKVSFGGFGRTSFTTSQQVFARGVNEPIMSCVEKSVMVDPVTRKPRAIPNRLMEEIKGKEIPAPLHKVETLQRPQKTFVHSVKTSRMDTDSNSHVNYLTYIKVGLSALYLAVVEKSKNFSSMGLNVHHHQENSKTRSISESGIHSQTISPVPWLTHDIIACGLKKVRVSFLRESLEGDVLNAHVWQEQAEKFTVKCSIENEDHTQVLTQIIFEYFGPASNL